MQSAQSQEGQQSQYLAEAVNISKYFGSVKALDNVSFRVGYNEIVGLVGDNGAGKSTLVKCFSGVYRPEEGELRIDGKPIHLHGARDSREKGIETIYQDLALIEDLPVYRNVFLAEELFKTYGPLKLLDDKRMREEAARGLSGLRIHIPSVRSPVRNLSGGQRQTVAVARAIIRNARLTFMDEPTAALGVAESREVLEVIRSLKKKGKSVVVVAHNMRHVMSICDRIVIMRGGRVVAEHTATELTVDEVENIIIGQHREKETVSAE